MESKGGTDMSIFDRKAEDSKKYYETEGPQEKCDIKEVAKLNENFIFRSTEKKHIFRQILVIITIAMGVVAAGYYLMMLFFKLVV